jgi:hypothetical protein
MIVARLIKKPPSWKPKAHHSVHNMNSVHILAPCFICIHFKGGGKDPMKFSGNYLFHIVIPYILSLSCIPFVTLSPLEALLKAA